MTIRNAYDPDNIRRANMIEDIVELVQEYAQHGIPSVDILYKQVSKLYDEYNIPATDTAVN